MREALEIKIHYELLFFIYFFLYSTGELFESSISIVIGF